MAAATVDVQVNETGTTRYHLTQYCSQYSWSLLILSELGDFPTAYPGHPLMIIWCYYAAASQLQIHCHG